MDHADKSGRVPWGRILLLGCVAAGGLYWAFFRTHVAEDPKPPIALIAGWDDLGACSNMASLDGARELKFFENQNAEMWDHSSLKEGESDIAQGVWSYDAATKRYALTLKGETTTYTLLSRGDPVTCILYKGHLDSADLRASWFSFPTSEESPDCGDSLGGWPPGGFRARTGPSAYDGAVAGATGDTIPAKERGGLADGELSALRSRPWWRLLAG